MTYNLFGGMLNPTLLLLMANLPGEPVLASSAWFSQFLLDSLSHYILFNTILHVLLGEEKGSTRSEGRGVSK